MIQFEKFTLNNGLKVIVHTDKSSPLTCLNILYNVGAKDESPNQTGFAHLFEHLMFGGSVNIPNFDTPLQQVGGENNAFTNNDITNYYLTVPSENIETGFWLESDRMLSLAFTPQSLEVQRSVVIEEFKQRYLNQPYGDVWLLLRPLVYTTHPYQWATIGKEISHIADAKMEDVKDFFKRFYCPNNAIMVLAGHIELDQAKELCKKWFEPIPAQELVDRNLPKEPKQTEARELTVERDVPANALYKVYHMPARTDKFYHACDLLSDILSNGKSARLYNSLVKEQKLFTEINAYIMGDIEPGMFVIQGKLSDGVDVKDANKAIENELEKVANEKIEEKELQKVKNKVESTLTFSEMSILNKAMNLAYYELLGNADLINSEINRYAEVSSADIQKMANEILVKNNCSTLYYLAKK
jgi:predicted Zn-dependent peptidase